MNTYAPPTRIAVPAAAADQPHVTILMAVYNGADHLSEQLRSIATQFHANWSLTASDDASRDDSRRILRQFAGEGHDVTICDGPRQGAAANFMSMLCALDPADPGLGHLAFCDQDDVWMPQRLDHGLARLAALPADRPALFCSGTMITDNALNDPRPSKPRRRPPGFRNALVQNIASGNTTLLNPAAARLVAAAAREAGEVVVHDWWVYQIVTGAGGTVIHDDTPLIYYRQHSENQIGANDTARARLRRVGMLLSGVFRDWNDMNIAALRASSHRLTDENRAALEEFAAMRRAPLLPRLRRFTRLGLYRQGLAGNAALWLSVILRRM